MNEVPEVQNKNCVHCFEKLSEKAKKCPHCQEWQTFYFALNFSFFCNILYGLAGCLFGLLFLKLLFSPMFRSISTNRKEEITVIKKEFFYTLEGNQPLLTVIGTLKNNSDIKFREITFEANFFNSEKKLIDTFSDIKFNLPLFPVSESNFKIRDHATHPKEEYSSFELKIKGAEERIF